MDVDALLIARTGKLPHITRARCTDYEENLPQGHAS